MGFMSSAGFGGGYVRHCPRRSAALRATFSRFPQLFPPCERNYRAVGCCCIQTNRRSAWRGMERIRNGAAACARAARDSPPDRQIARGSNVLHSTLCAILTALIGKVGYGAPLTDGSRGGDPPASRGGLTIHRRGVGDAFRRRIACNVKNSPQKLQHFIIFELKHCGGASICTVNPTSTHPLSQFRGNARGSPTPVAAQIA